MNAVRSVANLSFRNDFPVPEITKAELMTLSGHVTPGYSLELETCLQIGTFTSRVAQDTVRAIFFFTIFDYLPQLHYFSELTIIITNTLNMRAGVFSDLIAFQHAVL